MAHETMYWDEDGQTACEAHIPFRGSDTWRKGHWRKITLREAPKAAG